MFHSVLLPGSATRRLAKAASGDGVSTLLLFKYVIYKGRSSSQDLVLSSLNQHRYQLRNS